MRCLLRLCIAVMICFFCVDGRSMHLRNLSEDDNQIKNSAIFRITVVDTIYEGDDGTVRLSDEDEQISGIPIIDGKESDDMYAINLPMHIVQPNLKLIYSGTLYVSITNTVISGTAVKLTKDSVVSIVPSPRSDSKSVQTATGTKTITVVRVSTNDSRPKYDIKELEDGMFSPNKVNLRTQYMNCSFGQLEWKLSSTGVVDVFVNDTITAFESGASLVSAAQTVMKESMGISSIENLGDKVLMCLPPGTGGWIANAGVNHWRAQFNDEWCLSLTATMHEIGHLLGLIHSNENGIAYGDSTGYMAGGHKATDWPKKCFNGLKNWQLGWYQGRHLTLVSGFDRGRLLKLAAFVDYEITSSDEMVVVNVADKFYIQYNLAKDFNVDTEEKRNEVTITAPGDNGSDGIAGLKENEVYVAANFLNTNRDLNIAVCKRDRGTQGAYIVYISIAYDVALCDQLNTPKEYRTNDNTSRPMESQSNSPSQRITDTPTELPTKFPTSTPTKAPTKRPTSAPMNLPSKIPTDQPSWKPSFEPSTGPTLYKSSAPSTMPSIAPSNVPIVTTAAPTTLAPTTLPPTPEPRIDYDELLEKREESKRNKGIELDDLKSLFTIKQAGLNI